MKRWRDRLLEWWVATFEPPNPVQRFAQLAGFTPDVEFPFTKAPRMSQKEYLVLYCTWAVYMQAMLELKPTLEKTGIQMFTLESIAKHTDLFSMEIANEGVEAKPKLPFTQKALEAFRKYPKLPKLFKIPTIYMVYGDNAAYWDTLMKYEGWGSQGMDIISTSPMEIIHNFNKKFIQGKDKTYTCLLYRDINFIKAGYTLFFYLDDVLMRFHASSNGYGQDREYIPTIYPAIPGEVDAWRDKFNGNQEAVDLITPHFSMMRSRRW